MSVIGPRPGLWNQDILTAERDKYNANDVKPGLTGWAQINGRDELEIPVKAKLDGEYVKKMLIVSILQLLDQSIIGNSLWIEDGIVRRGFRYGENSDIIPLFGTTPYVQILMQDLYFFYIWGNTDRREESYQWFKNAKWLDRRKTSEKGI